MYSAILGVAAYALFGSSLTTLFYLFRENVKKCVTSPHHLFTISDALSSIFAGIIFLLNQLNMDTPVDQGNNNATKFNRDIPHFFKYADEQEKTSEMENPVDCGLNIIMHYGMFFIPFTNAFVSLLGYSLHYIINVARLEGSCPGFIQAMKQIMDERGTVFEESRENEPSGSSNDKRESSKRKQDSDLESIVSGNKVKTSLHDLTDINFNQSSKYDKMTLINLVVQWLLPFLITIILHFGEYPKLSEERQISKHDCIFTTNFPFETDCYLRDKQNQSVLFVIFSNSSRLPETDNNYIEATDSNPESNIHSQEIDNVVSNIYKLVNNTLSGSASKNSSVFSTSDLWNITKFMEQNFSETGFVDEWKLFQDLDKNQTKYEFDTNGAYWNSMENIESETNLENSNFETDDKNYSQSDSVLPGKNNNSAFQNESVSKNDIYEDLVKRIKNGIQKVKIKDKSRVNKNIILPSESQCLKNQCLISTNFLKIHLFILLFIVYFIPILASTIINVCVSYKFKQIKDKIETNCITLKILTNFDKNKIEMKNKDDDEMKAKSTSWFPETQKKFQMTEKIGAQHTSSMKIESVKEDELLKNILNNLGTAEKFTKLLKINLFLAILLWTPLFMEVLFKVFLCMNIPNWLMDSSFLGAISFGIARNFLNINMMKMLKADEGTKKDNSIHPSS